MQVKYDSGVTEKSYGKLVGCDLKRMLKTPGFYISLFLSLFILLRPVFQNRINGTFLQCLSVPFGTSDFSPFAAIFCALPFSGSFCEDYNSGFIKSIVSRTGVKRYSFQRCLSVLLSGGIMMALTVAIVIAVCAFRTTVPETEETCAFMQNTVWARMGILMKYHESVFVILKILVAFLFGAVWALAGLVISVFITNRYVTYIAPFVIYQILWVLLSESPFNPVYMFRGDSNFIPSFEFILIYQGTIITLCILVSCIGIRKKANEL